MPGWPVPWLHPHIYRSPFRAAGSSNFEIMNRYFLICSVCFLALLGATALPAQDAGDEWPQVIEIGDTKIVVYQPQPESFKDNIISGRAAVSVETVQLESPVFGAIWFEARVACDRSERLCAFDDIQVPIIRFPEQEDGAVEIEQLREVLEENFPAPEYRISLDRLLASLEVAEEERSLAEAFKNDPPEIIYRDEPAMLVLIDGEPRFKEYEKRFERVVNTPFLIVRYDKDDRYYLYGDDKWFVSSDVLRGWTYEAKPPSKVRKLEKEIRQERKESNGAPESSDDLLGQIERPELIPEIIVRTQPSELIQTEGTGDFRPIQGTDLLYLDNTESMVFLNIESQDYFVVFSGRWYAGPSLEGPWTFVPSDELPDDFADIPEGSDRDLVLAYVAGTEAAKEAVVDAYIPETATVDRQTASTEVTYDGAPQFQSIQGTNLEYAVNTSSTVLRAERVRYFCVDNGVWFEARTPKGPWTVATERPAQVERIPPSSPVYNVKYVYIYDYTPEVVYVGYTPGYTGAYVYGPTIVYGTGWYYRPWYGAYYYPRHWTWGFHMHYNPWTGWGFGWSMGWGRPGGWYYPPYWGWGYRPPYWGGYRPPYWGGWWGPGYYRPPVHYPGYNGGGGYYGPRPNRPVAGQRPGTRPSTRPATRPSNIYNRYPGDGVIGNEVRPSVRPGTRPTTPSTRPAERPTTRPAERPSAQPGTRPATRPGNDVFTDPKGDIYRRDRSSGQWQQRQNNQWQPAPQPSRQLDRYNYQRQRGSQRTEMYRRSMPQTRPQTRSAPRTPPRSRSGRN